MQNVSRFEASLLRLLYYFLQREPQERALSLIAGRLQPPPCLSRPAVRIAQDAIAKGCVALLAARGGWRDERHLRGDQSVGGRLWQRTPPDQLALHFSQETMRFLIWITANRPDDKEPLWQPDFDVLTMGDLVLLFFAHEGLRRASGIAELLKRPPFAVHGLCWLAYPEDFTDVPADLTPNFEPWTTGLGACILEAMQDELLHRWLRVESDKERIADPAVMRALGTSQDRVLTAFLDAVHKAGRRDLARFLLRAAARLLTPHAHSGMWTGGLQMSGTRLTDRNATYQAAVAFLRHLDRLASWTRWAKMVGYYDEDYTAAQAWLNDWEANITGPVGAEDTTFGNPVTRAHSIIRNLDPLRQGGPAT
jgi:FtsH ternary system domain X6